SKQEMDFESAKKTGAIAFFEDKYGDRVRVVSMGDYSVEFCGGCHVNNTSDIQYFLIKKESSPGAGNRRIEAVCGSKVEEYFVEEFQKLSSEINDLNLKIKEVTDKKDRIINKEIPSPSKVIETFRKKGADSVLEFRNIKKELEEYLFESKAFLHKERKNIEARESANLLSLQDELLNSAEIKGNVKVVKYFTENKKIDALKELGDSLKNKSPEVFLFFVNKTDNSDTLLFMAGKEAVKNGVNCNNLLKKAVSILDGRGGGKPDMAQGSAKNRDKLEESFNLVLNEIK
ncbi:MAG: alanine--tRNA ligase, partial [Leptospiraceae bacterium]|nr:alanine--tRNA ligase [Leptospiraceae bacterium]